MKAFFIYALNCPITGAVRYVGKSKNPSTRFIQHISESKKGTNHRACWIRSLAAQGLRPILEIVDEVPVEHWQQLEVAYIEFFQELGFALVNGTPGGEDPPPFLCKGRKYSLETLAKMSAAKKGKKWTLEALAKRSATNTGRKRSPEAVAKTASKNRGQKRTPEQCAKSSASLKGRIAWNKGMKNGSR